MPRGDRGKLAAAIGLLILAVIVAVTVGWLLQPEQPQLSGDTAFKEQQASYRAGGSRCEPAVIRHLPDGERQGAADACENAQEQSRQQTNGIVEARRSANAANASAVAAYEQARIAAWGIPFVIVTMFAAIVAAIFAGLAAVHTKRSADAAHDANRLAASTQRAWISVEASVLSIEVDEEQDMLCFSIETTFKNIGQTVATNVQFHSRFTEIAKNILESERIIFEGNKGRRPARYKGVTIIPGESHHVRIDSRLSLDVLRESHPNRTYCPAALALCDYSIVSDSERHRTDGQFLLVPRPQLSVLDIGVRLDNIPSIGEVELSGGAMVVT